MQGVYLEKLVLLTQKVGKLEPNDRMGLLLEHLLKLSIREIRRLQLSPDRQMMKLKRDSLDILENHLLPQVYLFKMKARYTGSYEEDVEIRWARQETFNVLSDLILHIAGLDQKMQAA